jgi:hypothetical protein
VRPYLKKPFTKIGLAEWLKVKALSLNPSTTEKKKDASFNTQQIIFFYIVIFSFCFWYQPLFPEYVLIVGLTFRISIPFRNPHAGVEK